MFKKLKNLFAKTVDPLSGLSLGLPELEEALARVRSRLPLTPLTHSPAWSDRTGRQIYFKWDNKLPTGSFKERGVVNFLTHYEQHSENVKGVCAYSMGNHALALSAHARHFNVPCTIVMPVFAPLVKVELTRQAGAEVVQHGESFDDAKAHALKLAEERGLTIVPGFDHPAVIAGQASCGLEILQQLEDFDSVIVPVGGGGLIAGIGLALKLQRPDISVFGVQSEWVMQMRAAKEKHLPMQFKTSIADGIAVKTLGAVTAPLIERHVDETFVAREEAIAAAVVRMLETERIVVEGAGAAGLCPLLDGTLPAKSKKVVVVISGSNIDMNLLSTLIGHEMVRNGRVLRIVASVPDRPGLLSNLSAIIARNGANVMHVHHDRFSSSLGLVDIEFIVEVRNQTHGQSIIKALEDAGVEVRDHGTTSDNAPRFVFGG